MEKLNYAKKLKLFFYLFFFNFILLQCSSLIAANRTVHLYVNYKTVNFTGKVRRAIAVNNQIPAPTLHFKEGDHVTLMVHNLMPNKGTTIHWHGILVPWQMDGVEGISQKAIPPGGVFNYRFTLYQAGTYWYHAHTDVQEQEGLYGAFLIDPLKAPPYKYSQDRVIVLSDWSNTPARQIFANLKKDGDYYSPRFPLQPSLAKFIHDYRKASPEERKKLIADYKMMQQMRMSIYDISDVAYDAFLLNGQPHSYPWQSLVKVGDVVRLRFIGAAGSTIYHVKMPGTKMQMVHIQGNDVKPYFIDDFTIAPGETYDVLVKIEKNQPYIIYAESLDTLGVAIGALVTSPEQIVDYESVTPFPEPLPVTRAMMENMMMSDMDHGSMKMDMNMTRGSSAHSMKMGGMNMNDSMDHSTMKMSAHSKMKKRQAMSMTMKPGMKMSGSMSMDHGMKMKSITEEKTPSLEQAMPMKSDSAHSMKVRPKSSLKTHSMPMDMSKPHSMPMQNNPPNTEKKTPEKKSQVSIPNSTEMDSRLSMDELVDDTMEMKTTSASTKEETQKNSRSSPMNNKDLQQGKMNATSQPDNVSMHPSTSQSRLSSEMKMMPGMNMSMPMSHDHSMQTKMKEENSIKRKSEQTAKTSSSPQMKMQATTSKVVSTKTQAMKMSHSMKMVSNRSTSKKMPGMKMEGSMSMDHSGMTHPMQQPMGSMKMNSGKSHNMNMSGMNMKSGMQMNKMSMDHSMNMKMPIEPTIVGDVISPPHAYKAMTMGTKYQDLTAAVKTNDPKKPVYGIIRMELFGYMDRFIWMINGLPEYKTKPILIEPGKRYRIIFTNNSMMRHPMHIHGHWFILRNGHESYDPLLHTIEVAPGATAVADFDTDASGQWFFHCHHLYHMMAGMSRVFQYTTLIEITKGLMAPEHYISKGRYYNRPIVRVDEQIPIDDSLVHHPMAHPAGLYRMSYFEPGEDPYHNVQRLTFKGLYGPDYNKVELFTNDAEMRKGKIDNADIDIFYWRLIGQFWSIKGGVNYFYRPAQKPYWQPGIGVEGLIPWFIDMNTRAYYHRGSAKLDAEFSRDTQITNNFFVRLGIRSILATKTVLQDEVGSGLNQMRYIVRPYYRLRPGINIFVEYEHEQAYGAFKNILISEGDVVVEDTVSLGFSFLF